MVCSYMYWVHTELVGRLPFGLEYIINSPMAHRMHHRPPGNCNYAGVFIVWDRLFGTYIAEEQQHDWYGLAASVQSFDPLVLNTQHFGKIGSIWRSGRGVKALFTRRPVLYPGIPFSLRQLWAPIPTQRDMKPAGMPRTKQLGRGKWDGEAPMSSWMVLLVVTATTAGLVGVVGLLVGLAWLSSHVAALAIVTAVYSLWALGRMCNQDAHKTTIGATSMIAAGTLISLEAYYMH